MLLLATILNLIISYLIASISAEFLVIFIAFFALIILNLEILSLFEGIKDTNILFLSCVFLLITSFIFKFKKAKFLKISFDFKRLKNSLFLDKSLFVLFFAFLFLILISFFLAIVMPTLEPDSQTYHFLRAYEFVKNGSLKHFETGDIRALIMPINSEIFYSYMLAFKKNFTGYGILSFFAYISCIFSSWNICEYFKFSYRKRLWAIFVFSSLAAVIIQISSLQTDILVGALLLGAFSLYLNKKIYFSSLALAIAMGVKTTGLISLFGFFILLFGFEFLIHKKDFQIKKFFGYLIVNFLIFSSYNYILNFIHFLNPISNNPAFIGHQFKGGIKGYVANLINFSFQAFDFTGFKWGYYLNNKVLALRSDIFQLLNIPQELQGNSPMRILNIFTDEQFVGFGVLGFLLFLPSIFISSIKSLFIKNKKIIFLGILGFVFLINILILARACSYMVYSIRFIVAFCCLSFLTLIITYKKHSALKPIFVLFCLFYMILIPMHIKRMPFFGVLKVLKDSNYNLEYFSDNCYKGKLIKTLKVAPKVIQTITTKYKNCKKIAYIKGSSTSVLYLKSLEKQGYVIDFINPYNTNYEKLKNYDLVILEDPSQDDNIFNHWEIEFNYEIQDTNVIFDDSDNLKCYYKNLENKVVKNANEAVSRTCYTYPFMLKMKNFKKDFVETVPMQDQDKIITLYYFVSI